MKMIQQPELQVDELLPRPIHASFYGMELQFHRFSLIHNNHHPWIIPSHIHPTMEVHYILSGQGQVQIQDQIFSIRKNDLYVTLPFVPHQQFSSANDVVEEYCMECSLSFSDTAGSCQQECLELRSFITRQLFSVCQAPPLLLTLLQQLQKSCAAPGSGLQTRLLSLEAILLSLQVLSIAPPRTENAQGRMDHTRMAIKIKSYLDLNYCTPIGVDDVARTFYLSTKQLNRIFRSQYDQTIAAYLKALRLHHACRLLQEQKLTLREAALQSGLTGYQQLHRLLQQNTQEENADTGSNNAP